MFNINYLPAADSDKLPSRAQVALWHCRHHRVFIGDTERPAGRPYTRSTDQTRMRLRRGQMKGDESDLSCKLWHLRSTMQHLVILKKVRSKNHKTVDKRRTQEDRFMANFKQVRGNTCVWATSKRWETNNANLTVEERKEAAKPPGTWCSSGSIGYGTVTKTPAKRRSKERVTHTKDLG